MKRKLSFSSIFAIATVAMTILLITGCEQDEEYYSQSEETLAERMMTRSEGIPEIPDTIHGDEGDSGSCEYTIPIKPGASILVNVSWGPETMHDRTTDINLEEQINDPEQYVFRNVSSSHNWYGDRVEVTVAYELYCKIRITYADGTTTIKEVLVASGSNIRSIYATNSHNAN